MVSLVTGASGFLGGRLAQSLAQRGESVRILARKDSDLSLLGGLPIEVVHGSLEDSPSLQQAVAGCETIYHCAAASTDWASWDSYYRANVLGVQAILQAAAQNQSLRRFVHISTSDVYGYPLQAGDETQPLTDVGLPYNRTKIMGEQAVWQACKEGLPVTVIRPVSIYGPRGKDFVLAIGDLLTQNSMAVFDGGKTHAGLIYIDNAVDGIIRAARVPQAVGQAYNLRDDFDITWRQYVDALAEALHTGRVSLNLSSRLALAVAPLLEAGHRALKRPGKPLFTRHGVLILCRSQDYAIDKAKRDLGFRSSVSFEEGVERSAQWYRSIKPT